MTIKSNLFRDYSAESVLFIRRTLVAYVGIFLLTGMLIINLYHLQIIHVEDYRTRSNENRIKLVPIAPSRGIIYDRNGTPLALNRTIYQLELVPEKVHDLKKTITALRTIVDLTDDDLSNFEKERKRAHRFTSLPLKVGLTDVHQARFAVNQYRFPGIEIKSYQQRYYPYGAALTHVIGYVSKIDEEDIERLNQQGMLQNYAPTHDIGKLGIERYYENILHGKTGYEEVEVNNRGQVIRQLREEAPQAGKDITLTLDLNLQQYIETLLLGSSRAAVVVMDPRDGGIRAMVSNPRYDPNLFVNGISSKKYHALLEDENHPLINRATQGLYPPASTVKPYISVSALTIGVINKKFSLLDLGGWTLPGSEKRYRDWKKWGHGRLNVTRALEESADTFFYQVAYDMGIDKLSEWMNKFGYGKYTGIDLSEERAGLMPTRDWKISHFKKKWYQGDTIPVGIGQGYWIATPLQMSKALITLINDGEVRTPHLLYGTLENGHQVPYRQPTNIQIGDPHSGYWEIAKDGMYGVANRPNGTARKSFANTPYKAAAKSGTAQVYGLKSSRATYNIHKIAERLRDHKLMSAFAPYDKPTVGVVVILENGGGGQAIGTITRQILDYILINNNYDQLHKKPTVISTKKSN
ncbi:peptidoglycan DD-transpeptidase MrdA [Candidatus Steffania adelgidicola]|uniref:peptidoglycan DD-transpeptidase MrdA n=1 Tax=Candidatus Steffania adelgidicola TaxID=1076626 RepID=UPI001D029DF5|nr:peptidoglycan DD-transpeptidase MrdA [Candidatus Steffania adelgidicola]UDG79956.1 Peptidoglycan D,D-transpeptidase MrdA [Candidatus Steffania adelgidicola]